MQEMDSWRGARQSFFSCLSMEEYHGSPGKVKVKRNQQYESGKSKKITAQASVTTRGRIRADSERCRIRIVAGLHWSEIEREQEKIVGNTDDRGVRQE
jgi:hypothetical protein